ncbi:MAG: 3,4-dihydroxy-2-butanone-4-phosphate synthase [Actinomycetota bacterium]
MSFVPTHEALERIARGEIVIVVDGPDREDEGDLTMSAEFATPEALNFMITHGRGLLCMPCEASRLDELRIGPMVRINDASCDTPFGIPIDHRSTTTGISVHDRAKTINAVLDVESRPWDFRRPGHVFPLRARDGGVLERPGHTEASVDLCRTAGLRSVAVICEVLNEDGTVARVPDLSRFAAHHGLAITTIDDLIAYRTSAESRAQLA